MRRTFKAVLPFAILGGLWIGWLGLRLRFACAMPIEPKRSASWPPPDGAAAWMAKVDPANLTHLVPPAWQDQEETEMGEPDDRRSA